MFRDLHSWAAMQARAGGEMLGVDPGLPSQGVVLTAAPDRWGESTACLEGHREDAVHATKAPEGGAWGLPGTVGGTGQCRVVPSLLAPALGFHRCPRSLRPSFSANFHIRKIDTVTLWAAFSIQMHTDIMKSNLCVLSCLSFPFPCGHD